MTELKMNRAAFALIKDSSDRVLLVQSLTNTLYAGQWSLPGGVVEDGESLQTGAQREVMEEVGIVCTINQQIRQIVNTVNDNITVTTFAADYVSGEIVLQDEEIADARWFTLEETKELEIGFNIRELLERPALKFLSPDPTRDAPYAHDWFTRPEGRDTLLSMGNAPSEIRESTLEGEYAILESFISLEAEAKQVTRMITLDGITIGVIWIERFDNHGVKAPSIHLLIGNPNYRGKGIGRMAMEWAIAYVRDTLAEPAIFTRHLVGNVPIAKLNQSLGFSTDGEPYTDENGLVWQNILLQL